VLVDVSVEIIDVHLGIKSWWSFGCSVWCWFDDCWERFCQRYSQQTLMSFSFKFLETFNSMMRMMYHTYLLKSCI